MLVVVTDLSSKGNVTDLEEEVEIIIFGDFMKRNLWIAKHLTMTSPSNEPQNIIIGDGKVSNFRYETFMNKPLVQHMDYKISIFILNRFETWTNFKLVSIDVCLGPKPFPSWAFALIGIGIFVFVISFIGYFVYKSKRRWVCETDE